MNLLSRNLLQVSFRRRIREMEWVFALDNISVYSYPITAQQTIRMRCLGIVVVFLAISEDALCWFGIPPCHSNEECSNNWFCPSEGHCIGFYHYKHCECLEHHNHFHGTTTTTSTTPTSTTTTTTTQPPLQLRCSNQKISIIESLAENIHVEDDRVAACPGTQKHQSSEAFVIQKCNATTRSFWVPGPKTVQELCSERTISAYTPISTFYTDEINTAAFFIKCVENDKGLEIAFQNCQSSPKVSFLNETTFPRSSDFYEIYILP